MENSTTNRIFSRKKKIPKPPLAYSLSPSDFAEPGVGLGVGGHGLHGLDRVVDLVLKTCCSCQKVPQKLHKVDWGIRLVDKNIT